jgi:hypothetical protein
MTIGDQAAPTRLAQVWAAPPTPAFPGSLPLEVAKKREREDWRPPKPNSKQGALKNESATSPLLTSL